MGALTRLALWRSPANTLWPLPSSWYSSSGRNDGRDLTLGTTRTTTHPTATKTLPTREAIQWPTLSTACKPKKQGVGFPVTGGSARLLCAQCVPRVPCHHGTRCLPSCLL